MANKQNDGAVGYGRPPVSTRFKPGLSGNPKGRPKGTLNLRTDLREELTERIRLREGERELKVSKQRAMLKALRRQGAEGRRQGGKRPTRPSRQAVRAQPEPKVETALATEDQEILERFLARRMSREA